MWASHAGAGERAGTALAVVVAVGLLGWLLVPGMDDSATDVVTFDGNADGGTGPTSKASVGPTALEGAEGGADGGSGAGGAVGDAGGGAGATGARSGVTSATSGGQECVSPSGSAPGVTATEIKVAVMLTNIVGPAGNQTFGVPTTDEQQAAYEEVIGSVNASGGVACRKLVPKFYSVNPADQSDMQAKCLDVVDDKMFAMLDTGGAALAPDCYPRNGVPFIGGNNLLTAKQVSSGYPYMLVPYGTFDGLNQNTVFGLKDRGFFSPGNGFAKLGFVYLDCFPEIPEQIVGWLKQAGVAASQIVTYDAGCPTAKLASPSDLAQAVLKFQQSGVTHVTMAQFAGNFANFTQIAQQQRFKPKYGIPDETILAIAYGGQRPSSENIAGAIAITASRYGEERTPGLAPNAGTTRCNTIYQAHGHPPVHQRFGMFGVICSQLWMFEAAVEHAPALSREALAAGLQRSKSVEFSYPLAPNDFSGNRVTVGGQYWRPAEFRLSCDCWQVADPTFHPGYR